MLVVVGIFKLEILLIRSGLNFQPPITIINSKNIIKLTSINKEKLGAAAAKIRSFRKPEPFKGKGIKYSDEFIFRKEGKKK